MIKLLVLLLLSSLAMASKIVPQPMTIGASVLPSASVALQVEDGTFLADRMTTAERDAIPVPANLSLIANTDTNQLEVYSGGIWASIGGINTSASSTDNAVVRWDGTGANSIQNSNMVIDDSGNATLTGDLEVTGSISTTAVYGMELDNLSDVIVNSASGNELLVYSAASSTWTNRNYLESLLIEDTTDISPGDAWYYRTTPDENYRTATWGSDRFVVIPRGSGTAIYSTDAVTWNTSSIGSLNWVDVEYGAGIFVAVAENGSVNTIKTSSDGTVWTTRNNPLVGAYATTWNDDDSEFIMVKAASQDTAYSTNGTSWTLRSSAMPSASTWRDIQYGGGTYVAVSAGGTDRLAYSDDGISWTAAGDGTGIFFEVKYGNNRFVAVDYTANSNQIYVSDDLGRTWDKVALTGVSSTGNWTSISYGNGYWAITSSIGDVATSVDLINWNDASPSGKPANSLWAGAYSPDLNVGIVAIQQEVAGYETTRIITTQVGAAAQQLLDVKGLINAISYTGDGSQLTGVALNKLNSIPFSTEHALAVWDGNSGTTLASTSVLLDPDTNDIISSASITAAKFFGDGSNLTGISVANNLNDLLDVSATTPSDTQVLTYSSSSSAWVAADTASTVSEMDDLTDVIAPTPSEGEALLWDSASSSWVNSVISVASTLNDLTDVSATTPADGEVLKYSSASNAWVAGTDEGENSYADLTDTTVSGIANLDFAQYDSASSVWKNQAKPQGTQILTQDRQFFHDGWAEHGLASNYSASAGTFEIITSASTVMNDSHSFQWTLPASASATLRSQLITVPSSQASLGYSFRYSYDGDDDDIDVYFGNVLASASYTALGSLEAGEHRFEGIIDQSTSDLTGQIIFVNNSGASGKKLIFNGLTVYEGPFKYVSIQEENEFSAKIDNNGTATIASQGGLDSNGNNAIASVSRSSLGFVTITFTTGFFSVAPVVIPKKTGSASTNTYVSSVSTTSAVIANKSPHTGANSDIDFGIAIYRQGTDYKPMSEHVVTPARSTLTDWEAYTPTTQGLGTVAEVEFYWKRVGGDMLIKGFLQTGTTTAVEAQVSLPTGYTIGGTTKSYPEVAGVVGQNNNSATSYYALMAAGDTYLNFGNQDSAGAALVVKNGNSIFGTTIRMSFTARVPIEGWTSDAVFLVATPVNNTAIFSWDENNTAIAPITGENIITLNKVEKAASFASLSANKVTIAKGKYRLTWNTTVGANNGYWIGNGFIKNLTTSEQLSNMMIYVSCPTAAYYNFSTISGTAVVELTEATDFNLVVERTGGSPTNIRVGYDSGNDAFDRKAEFTVTKIK